MRNFWDEIKKEKRPLVIYGTGNGADRLIDRLLREEISPQAVFASSGFVRERYFRGYRVLSLDAVREMFGEDFVILLGFGSDRREVVDLIKDTAEKHAFYAPRIPLFDDPPVFTDSCYFSVSEDKYDRLEEILADEQSRKVLRGLRMYRMSADIKYIAECESTPLEAYECVLRLSSGEDYLDIGAYRGDTVDEFVSVTGGYRSITAVEPEPKTFGKLRENLRDLPDCRAVNGFMTSSSGEKIISSGKGRGTSPDGTGISVSCMSVDALMEGRTVSYMKIDAEGEEKEILKGASSLIREQKPKIRTAAYHRADDLFDLTDLVLSLRDDYKVYLRHYPAVPDWDTDLFFI